MKFEVCPDELKKWAVASATEKKKVDCSIPPNKFFDQIIQEEYDNGCKIFFCEVGRGEDDISNKHYKYLVDQEQLYNKYCVEKGIPCEVKNKFCIINFGSNPERDPPNIGEGKFINYNYALNDKFIDEFKGWFTKFSSTHNIYIEFVNMTNWHRMDEYFIDLDEFSKSNRTKSRLFITKYTYKTSVRASIPDEYIGLSGTSIRLRPIIYKDFGNFTQEELNNLYEFEESMKGGNYKQKYLKYKAKYLELKKELN
jgi:hypothetical protein